MLLRPKSLHLHKLISILFPEDLIFSLRALMTQSEIFIPNPINFNLPDALWVYALTSCMLIIWQNESIFGIFWIVTAPIIGISIELLQYFRKFPGTFDKLDLVFLGIGSILSILFLTISQNLTKRSIIR